MTYLIGNLRNRSSYGAMIAMLLSSSAYAQVVPVPQPTAESSADDAIVVCVKTMRIRREHREILASNVRTVEIRRRRRYTEIRIACMTVLSRRRGWLWPRRAAR